MNLKDQPLVSCIMPTYNRRLFVPYAFRYFLRQDYPNKELIVVDDGTDSIKDLVPDHPTIRYIRPAGKIILGEKRNYCVRQSKGNLIMHWDDDDWMSPHRIRYQVQALLAHQAEVCGLQQMLYYELQTGKGWMYQYPKNWRAWLAGGSLLYTRSFWEKGPFPNMQVASDTQFIWTKKMNSFVALPDYKIYLALIHGHNTSPKITGNAVWKPYEVSDIEKIVADDWPMYANLGKQVKNGSTHATINHINPVTVHSDAPTKRAGNNLVSACLLSYNRPNNIQLIIDSLHDYPFINEILVWNNKPGCTLAVKGAKVRVINSPENKICYGRFLCAQQAKNNIIYFQDDDAIIPNVRELYEAFINDPSCITYALSPNHYQVRDKYVFAGAQIAFLGWGSFIHKAWVTILDRYLKENENDYLFRREADKFFTLLLRRQNNAVPGKPQLLAHDSTPGIALYLEKEHTLYVSLAIRKALAFNRLSQPIVYPATWNIVITCMNYGHYLKEAVTSVLYNHADYVLTIVDDGSTDTTAEICRNLIKKYPFIQYLRNEQQTGAGYSRNRGIAASDSIFVLVLDADDKIGPEYLFEAEKLLRTGYDVANPDALLFGNKTSRSAGAGYRLSNDATG